MIFNPFLFSATGVEYRKVSKPRVRYTRPWATKSNSRSSSKDVETKYCHLYQQVSEKHGTFIYYFILVRKKKNLYEIVLFWTKCLHC